MLQRHCRSVWRAFVGAVSGGHTLSLRRTGIVTPDYRSLTPLFAWWRAAAIVALFPLGCWLAESLPPFAVVAILILLWMAVVFSAVSFRQYLVHLPSAHRRFVIVFLAAIVAGHWLSFAGKRDARRALFPFTAWAMFGQPFTVEQFVRHDFEGIRRDGSRIQLQPEQIVPVVKGVFYYRFQATGEAARDSEMVRTVYHKLIQAIATKYNKEHESNPLVEVVCYRSIMVPAESHTTPVSRTAFFRTLIPG